MDVTWHENIIAQLRQGHTDEEYADALIRYLPLFSEDELKELAGQAGEAHRWFYGTDVSTDVSTGNLKFKNKLRQKIERAGITSQRAVNAYARKHGGAQPDRVADDPVLSDLFNTTYSRGGHLYVNGKRQY